MAFEQKDNTGALFINDRREKETHPNAKGNALIDGVEYWVAAWTKTDRNGNKFQSLAFTRKDEQQQGGGTSQQSSRKPLAGADRHEPVDDGSIPF